MVASATDSAPLVLGIPTGSIGRPDYMAQRLLGLHDHPDGRPAETGTSEVREVRASCEL